MIAEGTTPNCVGELPDEAKKADARKRLEENEERYPKSIQTVENTALRRQYYSLYGYTHEDEIVWDRTKPTSYRNHPSIKKNEELQKSGILNLFFYCKTREEFEAKRESEVKFIIAFESLGKFISQIQKIDGFAAKIAETIDKTMNPYGKKVAFISEKQSWILAVAAVENNITL